MNTEVRVAGPEERDAVVRLIAGFRDYYGETEPTDETIDRMVGVLLADERTEFLLIGEPPVGVSAVRYRPSVWTGAEDAWLEDLFVVEAERGRGVGRALVEASAERARARGCKRIQLDANERNQGAIALYESLGFASSTPARFDGGRNLYLTRWL